MKLIIFDIDGTLTDTSYIDVICFKDAVKEVFGIEGVDADWSQYPHVTDRCVLEVLLAREGKDLTEEAFFKFEMCFHEYLQGAYERNKAYFKEIEGANDFIKHLRKKGIPRAIATGGLRKSAQFKLTCAGLDTEDMPLACSNDALTREMIVEQAIELASAQYGQDFFSQVLYIGDGVWDAATTKNLKMPFVGIGKGEMAEILKREGALAVMENYRDIDSLIDVLLQ